VAPREEDSNKGFTFDGENLGSVNPESRNTGRGDITPQKNTIDKSQGELYEENSLTASPPPPHTPIYPYKKNVYVSYTYTDIGTVARVGDPGGGSDVWCTRLPRKWSEAAKKICEEKGWSKSELTRNALCVFIQAYMSSGVDLSEVEVKPRNTVILNYNSVENNVNVGRPPYRKYERELEEPHLKAEFRNLAEEILKGPPKVKKLDQKRIEEVWVDPTPEEVVEWFDKKRNELYSLLRRMEKLKIQLTPEENELFSKVKEKLDPIHG